MQDVVWVLVGQEQKRFQRQLLQNEDVPWQTEAAGAWVTAAPHLDLCLARSWGIVKYVPLPQDAIEP